MHREYVPGPTGCLKLPIEPYVFVFFLYIHTYVPVIKFNVYISHSKGLTATTNKTKTVITVYCIKSYVNAVFFCPKISYCTVLTLLVMM